MPEILLRPYQNKMVSAIIKAFESHRSVMCQMPTGTGKTEVFIAVIQKFMADFPDRKILVIVHRKELLSQAVDRLRKNAGILAGTIESGQSVAQEHTVHVGMIGSLGRDIDFQRSLVVIDEAHHSKAEGYIKHIERLMDDGEAKLLGVTATPARLDGKRLSDVYETLLVSPSISTFIKDKYLSKIRYYGIRNIELQKLSYSIFMDDFDTNSASSLMRSPKILAETLSAYESFAKGRKTLIFCVDIAHSKAVLQKFKDAGIDAIQIDSETDTEERGRSLDHFRNTGNSVMINVQLFNEGFDCPDIDVVMLARPTQSITLYMQMIGRVTRKAKGKKFATVLDNAGNYKIHGLPTSMFNWKKMFYNEDKLTNTDFSEKSRNSSIILARKALHESQELEMIEIIDYDTSNICYSTDPNNNEHFLLENSSNEINKDLLSRTFIYTSKYFPINKRSRLKKDRIEMRNKLYEHTKFIILNTDPQSKIKLKDPKLIDYYIPESDSNEDILLNKNKVDSVMKIIHKNLGIKMSSKFISVSRYNECKIKYYYAYLTFKEIENSIFQ